MSTKNFGQDASLPFFCCPTDGHGMFDNLDEKAAEEGILFGLSSLATGSAEDADKVFPKSMPTGLRDVPVAARGPELFAAAAGQGARLRCLRPDRRFHLVRKEGEGRPQRGV